MTQARPGWWYSASQEEKLEQIDGCIELGMTARQCAMNCGCLRNEGNSGATTLSSFAALHGRSFASDDEDKAKNTRRKNRIGARRRFDLADAKNAYLSGEPVDFWSAR